jgi:hypothetical protein
MLVDETAHSAAYIEILRRAEPLAFSTSQSLSAQQLAR